MCEIWKFNGASLIPWPFHLPFRHIRSSCILPLEILVSKLVSKLWSNLQLYALNSNLSGDNTLILSHLYCNSSWSPNAPTIKMNRKWIVWKDEWDIIRKLTFQFAGDGCMECLHKQIVNYCLATVQIANCNIILRGLESGTCICQPW